MEKLHSPGTTLWATPAWIVLTLITGLPTARVELVEVALEGQDGLGRLGDGVDAGGAGGGGVRGAAEEGHLEGEQTRARRCAP